MRKNRNTSKRPKTQPRKIHQMVGTLLVKWEGHAKKREVLLGAAWKAIAGERIAQHSRPDLLQRGRLVVLVESAAWMNELTFLKDKIKIKAKNHLSQYGIEITEVVFRLGQTR